MIAGLLGYAIVVASLVGLAAASVELLLAELRRPRRFAWLCAFVVALTLPPLAWLLAPVAHVPPAVATAKSLRQPLGALAAIDWDATLITLWIAATTVLLALYAVAWFRLALLAKRWPRESSGTTPIVVADDVGPAVLGIRRPCIVLPRWLLSAPAAVRSTVITHESEHIAARDQTCIVAAQLVTILLPWNLPLWWFGRRLRAAIELDCDARVLQRGVTATHYADVLLAVGQHRMASPLGAATLLEPITQLERRIRIMLQRSKQLSKTRVASALALALCIAACTTQIQPPAPPSNAATRAESATLLALEPLAETPVEPAAPPAAEPAGEAHAVESAREARPVERVAEPQERPAAPERSTLVVYSAGEPSRVILAADRIVRTGDSVRLEGDIRVEANGLTIAATRATFRTASDGRAIVEMESATLTGTN